jgi:hypothetical protein
MGKFNNILMALLMMEIFSHREHIKQIKNILPMWQNFSEQIIQIISKAKKSLTKESLQEVPL